MEESIKNLLNKMELVGNRDVCSRGRGDINKRAAKIILIDGYFTNLQCRIQKQGKVGLNMMGMKGKQCHDLDQISVSCHVKQCDSIEY